MRIHFHCVHGLGDLVALTGAIRDLKITHPESKIVVYNPNTVIWAGNPNVKIQRYAGGQAIKLKLPYRAHIVEVMRQKLEEVFGIQIERGPDVGQLFAENPPSIALPGRYVVVAAGANQSIPLKKWPESHWHTLGRLLLAENIPVVQIGTKQDKHVRIPGTIDLIDKTTHPQLFWILKRAHATICPISSPVHIVPATKSMAPVIVIAGGREEELVTKYRNTTFLYDNPCTPSPCWKRAESECLNFVKSEQVGQCMLNITPEMVFETVRKQLKT